MRALQSVMAKGFMALPFDLIEEKSGGIDVGDAAAGAYLSVFMDVTMHP